MAVADSIQAELKALGVKGWQHDLAMSLAEKMDGDGNAATAKELRLLMHDLGAKAPEVKKTETVTDDLRAQREKRRNEQARQAKGAKRSSV